jgi:ubiquinone/menaquinone biosynthesis C-methylase UbiE
MPAFIGSRIGRVTKKKYTSILERLLLDWEKRASEGGRLRVLDVGAGNCWLLSRLSTEYTRVGLDLSSGLHGIDDSWVDSEGANSVQFTYGDGRRLPFHDGAFDLVYSNEFVSHVGGIDETIKEQTRVLKSGGILVIMDANILDPITFTDLFFFSWVRSLRTRTRRGGMRWLFHREEPASYFELNSAMKGWRDENIHSRYWWRKKLRRHSGGVSFSVSTFCSYAPDLPINPFANKILIVGKKL